MYQEFDLGDCKRLRDVDLQDQGFHHAGHHWEVHIERVQVPFVGLQKGLYVLSQIFAVQEEVVGFHVEGLLSEDVVFESQVAEFLQEVEDVFLEDGLE